MTVATKESKMGKGVGFERIRRITGYLVGTMDKWNDAKRPRSATVSSTASTRNDDPHGRRGR